MSEEDGGAGVLRFPSGVCLIGGGGAWFSRTFRLGMVARCLEERLEPAIDVN